MFREMRTRFGKFYLGYMWAIVEPLFFLAMFYTMFTIVGHEMGHGMDTGGFILTGFIPYMMCREILIQVMNTVDSNKPLLFFPLVNPIDFIVARWLLDFVTISVIFLLLMLANAIINQQLEVENPILVIVALLMASLLGASIGFFAMALNVHYASTSKIVGLILKPLLWISGIFYAVNDLPEMARNIVLYNPLIHIVEFMRDAWFGGYEAKYIDLMYPLGWVLFFGYFGLVYERRTRKHIRLS